MTTHRRAAVDPRRQVVEAAVFNRLKPLHPQAALLSQFAERLTALDPDPSQPFMHRFFRHVPSVRPIGTTRRGVYSAVANRKSLITHHSSLIVPGRSSRLISD